MPETSPRLMSTDELREHAFRSDRHARAMAERMFFLESVLARALHEHSVPDRVCVCRRCAILRVGLRADPDKGATARTRAGDVSLPDDPEAAP